MMVTIRVMNVNEAPDFMAEDPEDYAENGTGTVATFAASDPEGADVTWSLDDVDKGLFEIEGGVLTFKDPPNFEMPGDVLRAEVMDDPLRPPDIDESVEENLADNNEYVLTVIATEVRPAGSDEVALSTEQDITVTVTNVDEPGMVTLDRLQTRVGADAPGVTATVVDPDGDTADHPRGSCRSDRGDLAMVSTEGEQARPG